MSTIAKPSEREEWLAVRRPYFNASAAAVLFDRHPYMTPGDYATIKLTGIEQAQTSAMRRGALLEDAIATWWGIEHACTVEQVDYLHVNGCLMATLDRWAEDDDCPIEIKTTNNRTIEPARYWLDQCQAIMACCGAPVIWLVWFDPSFELHERMIAADHQLQDEILVRAERFMAAIELGIIPDWIELSYQNVAQLYPRSRPDAIDLDEDGLALVQSLDMTRRIKRDAEKDESTIKDALAKRLLDAECGAYDGHEILTWRTSKPRYELDLDMLRADHPDLVEKYTVEKPGRRTMLVKLDAAL